MALGPSSTKKKEVHVVIGLRMEVVKYMPSFFSFFFNLVCDVILFENEVYILINSVARFLKIQWAQFTFPLLKFVSCQQMWSKTIDVSAHVKNPMWSMLIDHMDLMTLFKNSFPLFFFYNIYTSRNYVYEFEIYERNYWGNVKQKANIISLFFNTQVIWFVMWIKYC